MKRTLHLLGIILFILPIKMSAYVVTPFYSIRSQGVDAARELAGWTQHVNLFDIERMYGSISLTPEYTRSFSPRNINQSLFNQCTDTATIVVSGSQTTGRTSNDWLADYFYLPPDFVSYLKFNPLIDNFIFDINCYFGLDEWVNGLFVRVHLPVVRTHWTLDFVETVSSPGTKGYEAGYFAPEPIMRNGLLNSFTEYASGKSPMGRSGTIMNPLRFAKIENSCTGCGTNDTKTRLAELQAVIGWNFLQDENYHFGVGLRMAAPTGSRVDGEYLFEPLAGNGRHWELGAQVTTHVMLWRSNDEANSLGFYCDANVTHLFNAQQTRTFDLKDKPLSRYMLAEKLGSPIAGLAGGINSGTALPTAQFQKEFTPVANITTADILVNADIQGDIAAQLTYVHGRFAFDLGYNFWARSCEKFEPLCPGTCPPGLIIFENTWALKGDAYVVGYVDGTTTPVALSATQSEATINSGTNFPAKGIGDSSTALADGRVNPNIDNPQNAFNGLNSNDPLVATPGGMDATRTSIQPIFISQAAVNELGVKGLSNKVYAHFSYQWIDNEDTVPYIGIGGFAEFGSPFGSCATCSQDELAAQCANTSANQSCNNASCGNACTKASISQWGVWLKCGLSFS